MPTGAPDAEGSADAGIDEPALVNEFTVSQRGSPRWAPDNKGDGDSFETVARRTASGPTSHRLRAGRRVTPRHVSATRETAHLDRCTRSGVGCHSAVRR